MWYRMHNPQLGDTVVHINFGGRRNRERAPQPCQAPYEWAHGKLCAQMSAFQCDWKTAPGKTCDRYLCADHGQEVAPDKHLCPEHQEAYRCWLEARSAAPRKGNVA